MTPDISIVVPVYKAEPWLQACVDSVLAQTFEHFELILVDDGSPDGCPAICDEYAKKDPRVRVLHKENGGVASAVAAGIRAASGAFVGFADSDDWVDPDYYGELYRRVTELEADLVEGQIVHETFGPNGWESRESPRTGDRLYEGTQAMERLTDLYMTSFLYDGGAPDRPLSYARYDKLFRRGLLTDSLPWYDERLSLGEDAVLVAAVLPECRKTAVLRTSARYHHRLLAGTVSHQAGDDQLERIAAVRRTLYAIAEDKPLDRAAVDAFVGSMVHARIYRTAEAADASPGEKRRRMRAMLRQAPAGALAAFVRARGDRSLRLFYGLLRLGLAAPCVWMARLHGALQKRG